MWQLVPGSSARPSRAPGLQEPRGLLSVQRHRATFAFRVHSDLATHRDAREGSRNVSTGTRLRNAMRGSAWTGTKGGCGEPGASSESREERSERRLRFPGSSQPGEAV